MPPQHFTPNAQVPTLAIDLVNVEVNSSVLQVRALAFVDLNYPNPTNNSNQPMHPPPSYTATTPTQTRTSTWRTAWGSSRCAPRTPSGASPSTSGISGCVFLGWFLWFRCLWGMVGSPLGAW